MLKISSQKKTIALDFDGVLHSYKQGWTGDIPKDLPNKGAQKFVEDLIAMNYEVVIYSTRKDNLIKQWLADNNFPEIKVSKEKPLAELYVDDRAFRFDGDFNRVIDFIEKDISPWHDSKSD